MQQGLVLVHGEEEDEELRVLLLELLRGLDPVDGRHRDVEQDQIGLQGLDQAQRLGSIFRLADELEIRIRSEQRPETRADHGMVVSDQDANRHSAPPDRLALCEPSCACARSPSALPRARSAARARPLSVNVAIRGVTAKSTFYPTAALQHSRNYAIAERQSSTTRPDSTHSSRSRPLPMSRVGGWMVWSSVHHCDAGTAHHFEVAPGWCGGCRPVREGLRRIE